MKKIGKILLGIITAIILVLGGYLIYLFASYDRLPDHLTLKPDNQHNQVLETNKTYRAMSHNIGYGAYPPSYSFFMDGGKYSRAYDKKTVEKNMQGIVTTTKELEPTFAFYQEVTLSQAEITSSKRYSLPIETNFNKFVDLDRAFTVSRMPVKNGHEFITINTHLSAFTKDRSIQAAQLKKIFDVMESEYKKGNYVMVAGDYNHDVLGNSPDVFSTSKKRETWTHPFPKEELPAGFHLPTGKLAEEKKPSARALNEPYKQGKTYTTLIDGFLVSDNINVEAVHIKDMQFKYSDHNPVYLDFTFK